ncbi:MAG: DUF4912 domain-containing protein [Firmicutes bacterium]|nr:DUF4912 domain-containing protein [Bacillota bacterium]
MHLSSREYLDRGRNLPSYYGENRLVLLPRDPYWLFAYWEIDIPTRQGLAKEMQRDYASLNFALRCHRFTENNGVGSYFDLPVTPAADNWYIKAGIPDKQYRLEYGCYLPDGGFKVILTSNTVRTPRDSLSEIIDENWQLPDWQARRFYWRISRSNLSSLEMMQHGLHRPRENIGAILK